MAGDGEPARLGHGFINWCCEWRCPLTGPTPVNRNELGELPGFDPERTFSGHKKRVVSETPSSNLNSDAAITPKKTLCTDNQKSIKLFQHVRTFLSAQACADAAEEGRDK